jgi:hypothetical protein
MNMTPGIGFAASVGLLAAAAFVAKAGFFAVLLGVLTAVIAYRVFVRLWPSYFNEP